MFGFWTRAKRWRSLKVRCLRRTCTTRRLGWSCANPTRPGLRPRPKWGKDLALRSSNFSWAILVSHRTTNAKLSLFLLQETFLRFNHTLGYFSFSPLFLSLSLSLFFFFFLSFPGGIELNNSIRERSWRTRGKWGQWTWKLYEKFVSHNPPGNKPHDADFVFLYSTLSIVTFSFFHSHWASPSTFWRFRSAVSFLRWLQKVIGMLLYLLEHLDTN